MPTLLLKNSSIQKDFKPKLDNNGKLISKENKKYINNNLCFHCGLSSYKISGCNKHQTLLFSGNVKTRKFKATSSEKSEN